MTIRSIDELDDRVKDTVRNFTDHLDSNKIPYVILETRRTKEVQEAYYAQGRESLTRINALRSLAGLNPIGESEGKRIITWTRKSKHIDGLAVDIAPVIDRKIPWNVTDKEQAAAWLELGAIGESFGLDWGGKWPPFDKYALGRDVPHFELPV